MGVVEGQCLAVAAAVDIEATVEGQCAVAAAVDSEATVCGCGGYRGNCGRSVYCSCGCGGYGGNCGSRCREYYCSEDNSQDQVVAWINCNGVGEWKYLHLILEIRSLMSRLNQVVVEYEPRETNLFADALAKRGADGGGFLLKWSDS
ncbi:hypothetical protein LWI29_000455 [Acer saccharum]|uniref:RNase H type-1 domain-containing protein n=1 Tax=Acer saccharum TaxID=4024 RepID=A0AA39W6B0_ACESA|nr:hypothetical protein LWI29_000455 [Acer saccharum]